ncbi:MAG: AAA family ATPase [Chloroflexi bacterium]|nr:AAA family ATPase [Chloroflexota bacterium]
MTDTPAKTIDDTPLLDAKSDKLGFGDIAQHLANAFLQNDLSRGFVVGVEGAWGSGKSSLVNMALKEFEERENGPRVVKFAPWLVGNRNELLAQFFGDLEPVIVAEMPESERDNTKNLLRRYSQISSGLAALADLGELGGIPHSGKIAKLLRRFGQKTSKLSETSLADLNRSLRKKLKKLERPIVVFVDDLDRLDPSEVAEVLRLIKAVADFPNVAYILAYDPEIIAESVKRALGISDGRSYLEKVIQASFKVPSAMNFDLRNWLQDEVNSLIEGASLEEIARNRLAAAISQWCNEYLETPRDVVRVVNALKLNFMPVKDHVNPADMVFLQIIRTKNHLLFNWIERYVSILSAIGDWDKFIPEDAERARKELLDIIEKEGETPYLLLHALSEHLPRFNVAVIPEEGDKDSGWFSISGTPQSQQIAQFDFEKRLASPNHYSYYFSFSHPSGSLSDSEVEQFLIACKEAPEKAVARFRELIEKERPQGGCLAEVLLDRIVITATKVSPDQVEGLFDVLGETIDELIPFLRIASRRPPFMNGNLQKVFGLIINQITGETAKSECLKKLFFNARSIAWLTAIIREATLERRSDNRRSKPKEDRLLSEEDFETIKGIYHQRLSGATPSELLQVPYFFNLMYAWRQLGYVEKSQQWVKKQTENDEGFLEVLGKMISWNQPSGSGVQYIFQLETLDDFFGGVSEVEGRLKRIADNENSSDELRNKAEDLRTILESRVALEEGRGVSRRVE